MDKPPLLRIQRIHKSYATPVLSGIDLDVRAGEVHALIGANGAGKTTLAKIVCGLTALDRGEMLLEGQAYAPATKAEAEDRGVHIVQQELNLIGTLSVAENLFLNRMTSRWGFISLATMCRKAREVLTSVGLEDLDPMTGVEELGVGKQQLVEIAAALSRDCRVLILDEPTAALTDPQVTLLFEHIARLKQSGVGIIYVSHRLEELRRIADRATILRDGQVVTNRAVSELTMEEIVRQMVGQELREESWHFDRELGRSSLRVEGLCCGDLVRDVTFEVKQGELFGIAGLVGSGRTELLRAIFGADRAESGGVSLGDVENEQRFESPRDAVRAGMAMIPEDRKQHGLLLTQAVRVNLTLGKIKELTSLPWWIDAGEETREALDVSELMQVHSNGIEQAVVELSGGNQQKVVIGRWIAGAANVFLFDEPTRGIDVGAKAVVYHLLNELAQSGKSVVVVSSDLPELLGICDRIGVLSAGRLVEIFDRDSWSEEKIMKASFSGYME